MVSIKGGQLNKLWITVMNISDLNFAVIKNTLDLFSVVLDIIPLLLLLFFKI